MAGEKITSPRKVKKPFQILAEVTEKTFPGAGTMASIACTKIEIERDGQYTEVEQIGPEDLLDIVRGNPVNHIRTTGPMLNTNELQRFMNPANDASPATTVSESLSALLSLLIDGTETYLKFSGVRPQSGVFKFERGKPHEQQLVWRVLSVAAPITTPPAGVTLQSSFPSGTVYRHKDMGANAFQWNSVAIPITTLTVNVDRGTEGDPILGQEEDYGQQPYSRKITATWSFLWVVHTLLTDYDSDTTRAYTVTLNTAGPKTITGNARLLKPKIPIDATAKGAVPQEWEVQFLTATAN